MFSKEEKGKIQEQITFFSFWQKGSSDSFNAHPCVIR